MHANTQKRATDEESQVNVASGDLNLPPELAQHPKYAILKQLGQGGMGTVYLAQDRALERTVAIKVMTPDMLNRTNALERFLQEARTAAKLPPHPNVVQIYSLDQAGPLQLIVMEHVQGTDLESYVRDKGPLPVPTASHFLRQAALGLHHAFEHGMVHRDIKPNNLMVTPKGQIKILDFGLAKLPANLPGKPGLTGDQAIMGTVDYMAPEQAMSARDVDIRADLYSFGCTAYYLLTGRPPFVDEENKAVAVLLAHQTAQPTPLQEIRPEVPTEFSAVVAKLLAKLPQDRFAKPVELAQALVPFAKRPTAMPTPIKPLQPAKIEATPKTSEAQTVQTADTSKEPTPRPMELTPKPERAFGSEPLPKRRSFTMPRIPLRWLLVGAACAVTLVILGIVVYVETDHGMVRIELSDPHANVAIFVDNNPVLTAADGSCQLPSGEHELMVTGQDFETVTKPFAVVRGEVAPIKVVLVKKSGKTVAMASESKPNETDPPEERKTDPPASTADARPDKSNASEARPKTPDDATKESDQSTTVTSDAKPDDAKLPPDPAREKEMPAKAEVKDALKVGTVWKGTHTQHFAGDKNTYKNGVTISILERQGNQFKAQLEVGNSIRIINGTITNNVIRWTKQNVTVQKGEAGQDTDGRLKGKSIELQYRGVTARNKSTTGTMVLNLE